jgi:putative ABC transport system substrate-binding protein
MWASAAVPTPSRSWLAVLLTLTLTLLALPAWAGPVVVALKSDSLELYAQALVGFSSQAPGLELSELSLEGDAKQAPAVLAQLKAKKPALVLALGPLAANTVKRGLTDVPVLFLMVPNHEKYGLDSGNMTGIALTRPVEDQLAALHALLPEAKKVGVLYTPDYNGELIAQAEKVAEGLGLAIKSEKLGEGRDVGEVAKALCAKVDALWVIADRATATVAATGALLKQAREAKVPVFVLTEGQVREGGLVAFTASPSALGAQAGKLALRLVLEKVNPGALAVSAPQGLEVWVNLSAAREDGLGAPFSQRVLDYAAAKGLSVRAVP